MKEKVCRRPLEHLFTAIVVIVLFAMISISGASKTQAAEKVDGGSCGENLTWEFDSNGVLTVSGEGKMSDYSWKNPAPWKAHVEAVKELIIENGVTSIGTSAFGDCCDLISITLPESLTTIGAYAFSGCTNLKRISIPKNVRAINSGAFEGCSRLTSFVVPTGVTEIGFRVFFGCTSLTSIMIPEGVTTISFNAFQDCTNLSSILLPESLKTIYDGAFIGCSSLTSIRIPKNVTQIARGAFQGCSGLKSIVVDPLNAVYDSRNNCNAVIDKDLEFDTPSLVVGCCNTVIPKEVTEIGEFAFGGCSGLISITIPKNVTSICYGAFFGCSSLSNIKVDSQNEVYDSRNDCNAIIKTKTNTLIRGCNKTIIPKGVTIIDWGAFDECSGLTTIKFPEGVTTINGTAFQNCKALKTVELPKSLTFIAKQSFSGCESLRDVYYAGTEADRLNLTIEDYLNHSITEACWHYNSKTETPCLNHKWDKGKVTKEQTALAAGIRTYTCTVCKKTKTETIKKLTPTIKLSTSKKTIKTKKSFTLTISKLAKGDSIKSVKSNKKRIVTVKKVKRNKYKITGKKKGKVVITVTLKSGKKAKCMVVVR